jgi:uncharacterized surface protein with fasciclin (FAS1) repeats
MYSTNKYLLFFGFFVLVSILSCNKWDNHIAVNEKALNENLLEEISKHTELSKFSEYLVKTGLDKVISSSLNYTVWAPDNDALKSVSSDTLNDTAKLKVLLLNHISGQLYFTRMATDSIRVPLLNGKRVFFFNKKFDDATITKPDIYVRNGVLHVIDKVVAPLPNAWEYIGNTKGSYNQNSYISSLVYKIQDSSLAVLDSINPVTGLPVYKPNTGIVEINTYRTKIYDLNNEDSLYTYILLTNSAYATETAIQKPYFNSTDPAITAGNSSWNVVKDLAIKGLYQPGQLPATLLSKFNVHVTTNSSAIIETHKVSNGIVYVMNAAPCTITEKIPNALVQGEKPIAFSSTQSKYMIKVFYRQRNNPLSGLSFNDIYLNLGSIGANYYVDYSTDSLYATKYKVYWVALSDKTVSANGDGTYGVDSVFQQILQIGNYSDALFTPSFSVQKAVQPYTYSEVYLGDYTNSTYDWLLSSPLNKPDGSLYSYTPATRRLRLQAPPTVTTGIPFNLTFDYIKLVPIYQ